MEGKVKGAAQATRTATGSAHDGDVRLARVGDQDGREEGEADASREARRAQQVEERAEDEALATEGSAEVDRVGTVPPPARIASLAP